VGPDPRRISGDAAPSAESLTYRPWKPPNLKTNVFRAGAGVFNDRSGPVGISDVLRSLPGGLTRITVENPGYPAPFSSPSAAALQPPSIVRLAPDVQIPQTMQYRVGLDHQLQRSTTVSLTYTGARGYQVESTGRQDSDSMQLTLRGRVTRWFNGQMQYTLSRVYNDTSGIASFPANDYDLSGEWAPGDFDRRHRFLVLGRMTATRWVDLSVGLTLNSGSPYSETLGGDLFHNGRGRARPPGVPRNSLETSGYSSLDLRGSRDVKIGGTRQTARTITLAFDAFNVLNRVNYGAFVGTVGSPLFGQPVSALAPRQLQFSARVKF
jgi:hypothetical protein